MSNIILLYFSFPYCQLLSSVVTDFFAQIIGKSNNRCEKRHFDSDLQYFLPFCKPGVLLDLSIVYGAASAKASLLGNLVALTRWLC